MNKILSILKTQWKIMAGVVGLIVVIAGSGGACTAKVKPGKLDAAAGIPIPAGAEQVTVRAELAASRIYVVGNAASEERINLSARIPAYVSEVLASAGDRVAKGQVLIKLDDREIREQLAAAEAQLNQAQTEYDRAKQLFERNATTQQALTAAESMFTAARAQVEQVKVMLTYAQITSPIDGIVTDRRIEAGDLANPGMVLLAVYDPARMRLEAPVPVRLVDRLSLDQEFDVSLERPARTFKGSVTEVVSEVDPASRTQMVKIRLEGVEDNVLPGTFGRLWLDEEPRSTMRIPAGAVYRVGQLELVQVVENGRAVRRLVKTGPLYGERIEVLSGLKDGETVLANPIKEG
jgi:RND family efflux transporter MFP subunit